MEIKIYNELNRKHRRKKLINCEKNVRIIQKTMAQKGLEFDLQSPY